MATIQASIKLHDGMTPALKSMQNALHIVINSFENMQRTTGKGVNTKAIQAARNELAKARVGFNNIEKEIKENTSAQNKFNKSVQNGTGAANGLWNKIKGIGAAYLGFQAMKQVAGVAINTSDQLTQTTARLNMINDGLQTTKELEEMIYQSAQRSRAGFMDTADAVAKLGLRAGDIFKSNAETVQFAETLNKMFVIAGASQAEMSSATLQLTQALGSGVLRGEEFNAVFEAAPNVMQAVAKSMGVPIGQLRNLAGEGKISAKIVKEALLNATKDVNEQFKQMPMTWAQVWTSIKNYTIKATRPILDAISKITQSERFQGFLNNMKVVMSALAKMIGVVFTAVQKVCALIYDYWGYIEPILIAIAIVYLPTIIAGLWSAVTAVWSFVAGWLVANWPILLVVAAIALVIWALNYMGVTFADVAGAAMWCFAAIHNGLIHTYMFICNVWEWIVNGSLALAWVIYNGFFDCIDAIVNFFLEGFHNMKQGAVNFAITLLESCVSMAKGVDSFVNALANGFIWAINEALKAWNSFVSVLPDSVSGFLGIGKAELISEKKTSITADIQSGLNSAIATAKSELSDYTPFKTQRNWTQPTQYQVDRKWTEADLWDKSAYFDKGSNWGEDVTKKVKEFFSVAENASNANSLQNTLGKLNNTLANDPLSLAKGDPLDNIGKSLGGSKNPALDNISGDVSDIASNTSDIAADDENLDLMRDLAEREAINRYTLTDLKVEMTNNNNVNSALDLDDIVKHLSKKVYEGILASADGLHF